MGLEVSSALQLLAKLERTERKVAASQMLAEQMASNAEEEGVDELPGAYAAEAWTIGEMHDCNVVLLFKLVRKVEHPVLVPEGIKLAVEVADPEDCAKTAEDSREITVREPSIV